jgi:putative Holliday junction resolvase
MSSAGRHVGVDYGTKRVGLAMSDPLGLFAQPVGTFSPTEAIERLDGIRQESGIKSIVIGWPLEENGSHGKMVRLVAEYIRRLQKRLPGVQIVRRDERFSSERAKELIRTGERPSMRSTGRSRIDTAVAGLLLQEYLDEVIHPENA